ncbi:MAG: Tm-1-like ATP-binding domain-containing protein, partial [Gemmataceae bacterium]|nr:Tm-1-like ATP-binding domain-containing protein [Gemmataceae bacterium]
RIAGVLGLGGSAGTVIGTAAMRALPVGVPKLMVSTLASGQCRPYVGVRDVCMMHAVVDVAGLNRVSRAVLANAAAAIRGMAEREAEEGSSKPALVASMFGVTTPCVQAARAELEAAGYEVLVFHATGTGGQTLEGLVEDGTAAGVLDATTTELADELVGGVLSAGPDRLTAAGRKGVPQVVGLGALDMVNFGPMETVPARFAGRRFHKHNPSVTLMRTTPEENAALGREIARKLSAAVGPVSLFVPLRGVSALDREGGAFWWPEADAALFAALREGCGANVRLVERDAHVNDAAFAGAMAKALLAMLRGS